MPIYDYECTQGHRFERYLKLAAYRDPQRCDCGAGAVKIITAPAVRSDYIDPCYGADGKMHDSLASLRASYLPSGNPKGKRYIEIGDEKPAPYKRPVPDEKSRRDDIKAAIEDIKYGRVKPPEIAN